MTVQPQPGAVPWASTFLTQSPKPLVIFLLVIIQQTRQWLKWGPKVKGCTLATEMVPDFYENTFPVLSLGLHSLPARRLPASNPTSLERPSCHLSLYHTGAGGSGSGAIPSALLGKALRSSQGQVLTELGSLTSAGENLSAWVRRSCLNLGNGRI